MGCDIHSFVEVKKDNKWERSEKANFNPNDTFGPSSAPFDWRSYGMFGFLADVRNYSHVPCIIGERRGLPIDSEYLNSPSKYDEYVTKRKEIEEDENYHSKGYVYLKELIDFDYDKKFEDRRYTQKTGPRSYNGAAVADPGKGEMVTFREFLGDAFFADLEIMKTLGNPGDVRLVFWFDN